MELLGVALLVILALLFIASVCVVAYAATMNADKDTGNIWIAICVIFAITLIVFMVALAI